MFGVSYYTPSALQINYHVNLQLEIIFGLHFYSTLSFREYYPRQLAIHQEVSVGLIFQQEWKMQK